MEKTIQERLRLRKEIMKDLKELKKKGVLDYKIFPQNKVVFYKSGGAYCLNLDIEGGPDVKY